MTDLILTTIIASVVGLISAELRDFFKEQRATKSERKALVLRLSGELARLRKVLYVQDLSLYTHDFWEKEKYNTSKLLPDLFSECSSVFGSLQYFSVDFKSDPETCDKLDVVVAALEERTNKFLDIAPR